MVISMAKSIMIQGTMSGVGKSLLTAGLCRILKQDGYRVAPFKSQNMALNSYITEEGLEMGRAQVVQAEAAMIPPSVLMNPILLKPTTDVGSQVIIKGEVIGNMKAMDYFKYKKSLMPVIMEAYHELEQEYDYIVIEGAGSPAEINLKQNDIVNMGLAKETHSPVLLVGDIDRGGVFAQLAGTMLLLEEEEKDLVKAVIINKFRGDKEILKPGLGMLYDLINRPTAGVVPYMYLKLDDEDSLTERFDRKAVEGLIKVVVIKLPRISNFSDFSCLETIEYLSLVYGATPADLEGADLIIIPGTKNTVSDLLWMRSNGLETAILKQASRDVLVMGICGGFQMLGEVLRDPLGIEGGGETRGIGLLPIETIFEPEKVRTRVRGKVEELKGELEGLNGAVFEGYEIHMGISRMYQNVSEIRDNTVGEKENISCIQDNTIKVDFSKLLPFAGEEKEKNDGVAAGNVFGSYVHGIFDEGNFLDKLMKLLLKRKGLSETDSNPLDFKAFKETQYNLLADTLRESLDMDMIYRIMDEN